MNYYGEQCNLASEAILKTVMSLMKVQRIILEKKSIFIISYKRPKKLSLLIKSTIVQISLDIF